MNVLPAIVSVPDRAGPLVPATLKVSVPFPVPLPPDAMVIHGVPVVADHAQPPPAVTVTVPLPPADGTDCVSGEMANVQPCPWVTVTVCPATVSVPERAGPVVAATENETVPAPLPPPPDAIVSHGASLLAVHAQPAPVATVTVRVPPAGSAEWLSGATSKVQPADCVTLKICPATLSVPARGGPDVGATVKPTVPTPTPALALSEIQSTLLDAVHGQPAPAVTAITLAPPDGVALYSGGSNRERAPSDCVTL